MLTAHCVAVYLPVRAIPALHYSCRDDILVNVRMPYHAITRFRWLALVAPHVAAYLTVAALYWFHCAPAGISDRLRFTRLLPLFVTLFTARCCSLLPVPYLPTCTTRCCVLSRRRSLVWDGHANVVVAGTTPFDCVYVSRLVVVMPRV